MLILFPKHKGVKIATQIIIEEIERMLYPQSYNFIAGMIYFAFRFGAINELEQAALKQYLDAEMKKL